MPHSPLLLGHRGARATRSVPENTFASFDLALQHRCDGFEFDVRRTRCGTAVVCHDPKIGKTSLARATISQLPDVPLFEDVIQRYAGRAFMNIELKVRGLESKVLEVLRNNNRGNYQLLDNHLVSSFNSDVIMEMKVRSGQVRLGIICDKPSQLARWKKLPVDYVIVHKSLTTRKLVDEIHDAGRKVVAWTVNDRRTMLQMAKWTVDGLISDETELLAKTFG